MKKSYRSAAAAVLVIVIGSAVTYAQSLNDRLYRDDEEKTLVEGRYVKRANEQCGTQFVAKIDWSAVPPEFAGQSIPNPRSDGSFVRGSPSAYCFNAFSALDDVCRTEAGKT